MFLILKILVPVLNALGMAGDLTSLPEREIGAAISSIYGIWSSEILQYQRSPTRLSPRRTRKCGFEGHHRHEANRIQKAAVLIKRGTDTQCTIWLNSPGQGNLIFSVSVSGNTVNVKKKQVGQRINIYRKDYIYRLFQKQSSGHFKACYNAR